MHLAQLSGGAGKPGAGAGGRPASSSSTAALAAATTNRPVGSTSHRTPQQGSKRVVEDSNVDEALRPLKRVKAMPHSLDLLAVALPAPLRAPSPAVAAQEPEPAQVAE